MSRQQITMQERLARIDELSTQIASMAERNRLLKRESTQLKELSQLEERERISRELHDTIGHSISASILQLEALKISSENPEQAAALERVQTRLSTGMDEIREVLHRLRREAFNLDAKVLKLSEDLAGRQLDWLNTVESELPLTFRLEILQLIQEGVNNFTKHSEAKVLRLRLLEQRSFYSLEIADKGPAKVEETKDGIGLFTMRETAERYGGYFRLDRDNGFTVFLTFAKEVVDENSFSR
ncbi:MAG: histidine kinase [Eubacteriales bacterium]|nr:histidine kinase [Eubacteriales bacterium]